ncbi:MAG: vanadium-dependent haloperoxidase [Saprospiraceae bacterium]|nr:vanadium-dependent haloperoxidase [Saprospiraceae bacterium]
MKNKLLLLALSVMTLLTQWGCKGDDPVDPTTPASKAVKSYTAEVPYEWNQFYLEIVRFTPNYRPPISARTLAYVNYAAYEAAISGMSDDYNSLKDNYNGLTIPEAEAGVEYHWPTVVNAVYAKMFEHYFPTAPSEEVYKIYTLERRLNDEFRIGVGTEVFNRSVTFGKAVADAVYEWSATDIKGHQAWNFNTDPTYVPPTGIGKWQPTYPDYGQALLPHWGDVRRFAATIDDVTIPAPEYSTQPGSLLYNQALETYDIVKNIKQGLDYNDKWIADFWSDDCSALTFTPDSRWIAITSQIINKEGIALDKAIYAYAKVSMALNDAGVGSWREKFRHNLIRPVDYIKLYIDPDWNTIMCPDGSGNYFTPPFPSYPSGHGTFAFSAAGVLTDIFGNYAMVDECHKGRTEFLGQPRSFNNFYDMASECAYSRIPIGVHFRIDATSAQDLGEKIALRVNSLNWKK